MVVVVVVDNCYYSFINSDGAAALVLVSGEKALQLGLKVIAKISGYSDAAQVTYLNIEL